MRVDYIVSKVRRLKTKYAETDPLELSRDLGISIVYQNLGRDHCSIKGFFVYFKRIKCIVLNADLPMDFRRTILAHELGHAVLHPEKGRIEALPDTEIFDSVGETEHEANVFAAELLLSDDDVLSLVKDGYSFFDIASKLRVPPEILDYKLHILNHKGISFQSPICPKSNFLGKMSVNYSATSGIF